MNVEPQHLIQMLRLKNRLNERLWDWVLFSTVCFGVGNVMSQLP